MQLALVVVGGAVAAAHGLVGLHALGRAHTLAALGITDRPKCAVTTGLIYMEREEKGLMAVIIRGLSGSFLVIIRVTLTQTMNLELASALLVY